MFLSISPSLSHGVYFSLSVLFYIYIYVARKTADTLTNGVMIYGATQYTYKMAATCLLTKPYSADIFPVSVNVVTGMIVARDT